MLTIAEQSLNRERSPSLPSRVNSQRGLLKVYEDVASLAMSVAATCRSQAWTDAMRAEIQQIFPDWPERELHELIADEIKRVPRYHYPPQRVYNALERLTYILPNQKISTAKLPIKAASFGQPTVRPLTISTSDIRSNPKIFSPRIRQKKIFPLYPTLELQVPITYEHYGNRRNNLSATLSILVLKYLFDNPHTYRPSPYSEIEVIPVRLWDNTTQAPVKLTDDEVTRNAALALLREAANITNPYQGGLPGQNS